MAYAVVLLVCALGVLIWQMRRRLLLVTVDGHSMAPAYQPGDRLLALRRTGRLRTGDVVIFTWPPAGVGLLVKRVAALPGDPVPAVLRAAGAPAAPQPVPPGYVVVLGDGPGSVDSREWGLLPLARIDGVVIGRLGGPGPAGPRRAEHRGTDWPPLRG